MFGANAQPIPHTRKQTAAIFIIGTRPTLSAMRPDSSAPMHPVISAEPTARPSTASPGVKMFLDDRGGAIDDGGVVTVEQSAERGAGSKTGNDIAL